jgi:hypothetical protein
MKDATRAWIKYTGDRRVDIEEAKRREALAKTTSLFDVPNNTTLQVPRVNSKAEKVTIGWVQYDKPSADIAKVKKLLGNARMPNNRAGALTFEYFLKNESGD